MNLWARTLRQLSVVTVALFFFSCEDESSLLGFPNPNKKFHVGYVEIPLHTSSVLVVDSVITDLRPIVSPNGQTQTVDGIVVGEYQDPDFGKITARSFLGIYPTSNTALPATATLDSVTAQFILNYYVYGFSGQKQLRINVHEITGDRLTLSDGNRYYANSPAPSYTTDPIGEVKTTVHFDSVLQQPTLASDQRDTLFAKGRLSQDFGNRVFEAMRNGFPDSAQYEIFKSQVKGLALVPGSEPGVLGFNLLNNLGQLSRIVFHYHTMTDEGTVADTLVRTLGFDFATFTKIEAERSGTELVSLPPYEGVELVSGTRYVQSGAPVITKIDFAPFYNFADTVENIVINNAELVIDNVSSSPGANPHESLMMRLMNNNSDQFLNNHMIADRETASDYFVLSSQVDYYYFAATDGGVPATIVYDSDAHRFSGYMTLFAQSLFKNSTGASGINENRIRYIGLYPANPAASRSVTRTLFHKDNVKLRLNYTRANTVTP